MKNSSLVVVAYLLLTIVVALHAQQTLYNLSTIAGTGSFGSGGDGGLATSAELNRPSGVSVSSFGEVYIADRDNHKIRKIDTNGTITTIAGTGSGGMATSAQLNSPYGISISSSGEVYIADTSNNRIRTGSFGSGGDGGLATSAELSNPHRVVVSSSGEVYIADTHNNRIRKLTPWCVENTVAIDGKCEYQCFGRTNLNPSVCSGHGKCSSFNKCTCENGYSGDNCDEFNCFGILKNEIALLCSSHGDCLSPNNCSCFDGYYGSKCDEYNCFGIHFMNSSVCAGNGQCSSPNNCKCTNGFNGSNCEGKTSSGNGLCIGNYWQTTQRHLSSW